MPSKPSRSPQAAKLPKKKSPAPQTPVAVAPKAKVKAKDAKRPAVAPKAVGLQPVAMPQAGAVARPEIPAWVQEALAFSKENPAATLVGLVASALGLILLFS